MKPRSPVKKTIRALAPLAGLQDLVGLEGDELAHRGFVLPLVERQVVPLHPVLHEGDAAALDRAHDDHGRTITRRLAGGVQLERRMPIDLDDPQSEAAQLVGERIERRHLVRRAETLKAVRIDHDDEVCELLMTSEQDRFPGRPLLTLAVGKHAIDATLLASQALAERDA